MNLLVRVQPMDIQYAVQCSNDMNPPANALRRNLAAGWDCQVTDTEIVLFLDMGTRHRFHAPAEVTRCLMEFHETGTCEPFDFMFEAELGLYASRAIQADLLPT